MVPNVLTCEWPMTGMRPLVLREVGFGAALEAALEAAEGFFVRVTQPVREHQVDSIAPVVTCEPEI
jgi:hypothetical protein